ncbi:MAG: putative sulfate exporter family transporter [Candidatus Mariimomonas ferrooxydans]
MSNGKNKIDWSNLWRSEDWWSVWLGFFILLMAVIGVAPHAPKLGKWTELAAAFPKGGAATFKTALILFAFTGIITWIACLVMKKAKGSYLLGFAVIFGLSFLAMVVSKQAFIKKWGISYVLFALVFGLIISNIFKVPKFLKDAGQTEFFVKIGLVCMGATIMFSVIIKAGAMGMVQAILVATTVWFMTYWICRKFKISERFSSIIATANSICGVSATIAAGGAVQGDPKEVSYMVAWVLVCAVILILILPPIANMIGLPSNMAGAWLGGVIDNTGAVIAAGETIRNAQGEPSTASVQAATMVKLGQNVLIGFVAFFMALWATMSLEKKETGEKPSLMEVWYRFPKFVLGFMAASMIISFLVEPAYGQKLQSQSPNY